MRRRDFMKIVGGVAAGWPLAARAQQPIPVIGYLGAGSPGTYAESMRAFRQGLKQAMSRAAMSWSNTAGRKGDTSDCRNWRPSWSVVR